MLIEEKSVGKGKRERNWREKKERKWKGGYERNFRN